MGLESVWVYEMEVDPSAHAGRWGEDFLGCVEGGGVWLAFFRRRMNLEGLPVRSETQVDYRLWEAGGELTPVRVGNLCIAPPWDPRPGALLIDPELAFGSGHHPTTRMCLEALQEVYRRERPARVLDLGTGSGILAVAAARLGARRVLAVDHCDLALRSARRNVQRNGLEGRVEVRRAEAAEVLGWPCELLLANLNLEALLELLALPRFLGRRWYVLSGLLGTQVARLLERLPPGLRVVRMWQRDLWFALLLQASSRSTEPPSSS